MESVTNFSDQGSFSGGVVRIDEGKLRGHVDQVVRASVEETLNNLLEAEADQLCHAKRYERTPDRVDTRAGSYERQLHTKAGEVTLKVPRLRTLAFETQIIERYQRRESSVEEALVEMYLAGVSVRRVEDIRHESVHAFFSPRGIGQVARIRQNLGQWGYDNSQLLRFTEEAIAETYGSGSLFAGLRHPLNGGYGVSMAGLSMEGVIVSGSLFGLGYVGYRLGGGE